MDRVEVKVYMSRGDLYRVQKAAAFFGLSVSSYLRQNGLIGAEAAGIPEYRSVLEGQEEFVMITATGGE